MSKECPLFNSQYSSFSLKFHKFDEGFYHQSPLRVRKGYNLDGLLVFVLIGSNIMNWDNPQYIPQQNVDDIDWLRPVYAYGADVYCSDEVAFANYGYDNIFFHYTSGFEFPSRSPIGRPNYIDYNSRDVP